MEISNILSISLEFCFPNVKLISFQYEEAFKILKYWGKVAAWPRRIINDDFQLPHLSELFVEYYGQEEEISSNETFKFGEMYKINDRKCMFFGKVLIPFNLNDSNIYYPTYFDRGRENPDLSEVIFLERNTVLWEQIFNGYK